MQFSKIVATGSYLPKQIMTNAEFEKIVDTTDEWIVSRSGIKERRIVADGEKCVDLCYNAALDAINSANLDQSKIDLIIVATSTPDMIFPSTACILQKKLGLNHHVPAFDMQAACTGFIYGLTTADAYIKSGMANTVLLVGADVVSRFVDYSDRNTCVLFGDGAGAIILQASNEPGILANKIYADGSGIDSLSINGHIYNGNIQGRAFIDMDGKTVFKMAVKNLANVANQVLEMTNLDKKDINWLIPHQANIRIIEATADHLNIPMDKVIVTVDKHGNTSAASVPLALDHGIKDGRIKRGDLLMLEGVGAGFTWGASLVRY